MDALWILLFFLCAFVAWPLVILLRIVFSDADLNLLSKGPAPPDCFKDKVVWITGASKGIGGLLAQAFASRGARLIISSRNAEALEQVKASCSGPHAPAEVVVLPLDLTAGSGALKAAVDKAESAFNGQGIDILVHNAAAPRDKMTALETSEQILRAQFEVNVFSTIELTRLIMPLMLKRRRGQLVVVSSAAGKMPAPTQCVYAASKHALQGYFRTLASEIAGSGVQITVTCPGPIASADMENASEGDKDSYSKDRMTCKRCAELIVASAAHGVSESWLSNQPVLGLFYVCQYFPGLATLLFSRVGPKRVAALKAGSKELYGTNLLFFKDKSSPSKED